MHKLLLTAALATVLLQACSKTPRTVVVDDNPKYCFTCKYRTSSTYYISGEYTAVIEKDTTICDKTGPEIVQVMADTQVSTMTVAGVTLRNTMTIQDCKIK